MSSFEVYDFLKQNSGIAFSLKELQKRVHTQQVVRKIKCLVKTRMVKAKQGVIDYKRHKNIRLKYYSVGEPTFYIPQPKQLM